ncbi:MAG: ABC transporter permease [Bacteroidetes bacterium]|nr:ABC transporter permease [Bacteroidota bacterium]MBK9798655.1 ABC transporter permease [Bacteroidota bacterium]MBP6413165.1 ABC transporter permease [Bacteroidia bacterium]
MKKILASITKEFLILVRDRAGLGILFLMPMILVFIMTFIQDAALKSINESGVPILFVDEDQDTLGSYLEAGIAKTEFFKLEKNIEGKPATLVTAQKAVAEGKFMMGIIIPKGATHALRNNVKEMIASVLADSTEKPANDQLDKVQDSLNIIIFIDPVTKKSFISSITASLREFISKVKSQIIFKTFKDELAQFMPVNSNNSFKDTEVVGYQEIYARQTENKIFPNSVQHNVPAWIVFAMFFIVIPLSGSIIMERGEGASIRIKTLPGNYLNFLAGKIIVYLVVCLIQFLLMLSVGLYILPQMGLPVLQMGSSPISIIVITFCSALAAIGFGVMVGTIATTHQQASISGSVSVLILAAIGGIWVPVALMPDVMKTISLISPLNWGLSAFHELFLRNGNLMSILNNAIRLLAFFCLTMGVAYFVDKMRRN